LEATINGDDIKYRAFSVDMEAVIEDNTLTLHNLSTGEVEIRDITQVDGTHYELYKTYKGSKYLDVATEALI